VDPVERQYTEFPYPDYTDLTGMTQIGDPSLYSSLIWPEGRPKQNLRILVAGCGTIQAAMLARTNRECEVIGLDLSESSLRHERLLQEKYELTNLSLFKRDLRDSASFGRFDLIFAIGVLHHMQHPAEGLSALRAALEPHGAIHMMLYGATRRYGVYLLQDAFRRIGAKQDRDGITLVRAILRELPDHHFAKVYLNAAHDLNSDAGLVDTFLHPVDQAYTVPKVLDLVKQSGLVFQCWGDNATYYPDSFLQRNSQTYAAVANLPDEEQWAVMENINLLCGQHALFVCRPERDIRAQTRPSFEGDAWSELTPTKPAFLKLIEPATEATPGKYQRAKARFNLTFRQSQIYERIGKVRARELAASNEEMEFVRTFLANMWRRGHVYLTY
jgi:trans-aconitate methyltransferase